MSKKLYGTCSTCDYWYIETLWIGKDVPPELNQPKDHPCPVDKCVGVVVEVVR